MSLESGEHDDSLGRARGCGRNNPRDFRRLGLGRCLGLGGFGLGLFHAGGANYWNFAFGCCGRESLGDSLFAPTASAAATSATAATCGLRFSFGGRTLPRRPGPFGAGSGRFGVVIAYRWLGWLIDGLGSSAGD